MPATIYQITNKTNGKSYIGFTTRFLQRLLEHKYCKDASGGNLFHKSIKKYGWKNFTHKILYIGEDELHTLKVVEPFFIKHLNTKHPNGYNLTEGGDGTLGLKRKPFTKEHKLKIGLSQKGIKNHNFGKKCIHSKETKIKILLARLGKPHPHKGSKKSLETRTKISLSHLNVKLSKEHIRKISLAHKGQIPWNKGLKLSSLIHKTLQ